MFRRIFGSKRRAARGAREAVALYAALLACSLACTREENDAEPALPERQVDDAGENRALFFDGNDDYLTSATAAFPEGRAVQTLAAWFRLDELRGKQALLTLRKDLDSGVELAVNDGVLGVNRVFGARTLVADRSRLTPDVWHHVAYVFDGSANLLYLDGALADSSQGPPDQRTPTSCWVGTFDGVRDLLHGRLDDVRVYASALPKAAVLALAMDAKQSVEAPAVLDLSFDEQSGPIAYDHSPQENDGLLGDGIDERMPTRVPSNVPSPR